MELNQMFIMASGGKATLTKLEAEGVFAFTKKKFNPETGEEITPEVMAITRSQVEAKIAEVEADLAILQAGLATLNDL